MTELARRIELSTDPTRLRRELLRVYEDLFAAIVAEENRAPARWAAVSLPDGGEVRAQRDQVVIGQSGTVRPPGNPRVADSFRVLVSDTPASVLVQADDGMRVQGSLAGESWANAGWAEYMFAGSDAGWRRRL